MLVFKGAFLKKKIKGIMLCINLPPNDIPYIFPLKVLGFKRLEVLNRENTPRSEEEPED